MLWMKALHIIAVVCWFAGLFYLPRLFVYHTMAESEVEKERFKTMQRKLYWGITTPSMIATLLLGLGLMGYAFSYYLSVGWMHAKLLLVALLIGYHVYCGVLMKAFARDENRKSQVFYRWFNEFPVLILVAVVILVVVKPF